MRRFHCWNAHHASEYPYQNGDSYRYSSRSLSTMRVEFAQRIDNREKSISWESCECEHRDANWQILEELWSLADNFSPRPRRMNKNRRREWHLSIERSKRCLTLAARWKRSSNSPSLQSRANQRLPMREYICKDRSLWARVQIKLNSLSVNW